MGPGAVGSSLEQSLQFCGEGELLFGTIRHDQARLGTIEGDESDFGAHESHEGHEREGRRLNEWIMTQWTMRNLSGCAKRTRLGRRKT
jgi:hypothetical protein